MARPKIQLNRRTDIINAAQILFEEKGFEKTSIDEIAKAVGIGKGSLYLDFNNKEEILKAIIEHDCNILIEDSKEIIKQAKPPYIEVFKYLYKKSALTIFDSSTANLHSHLALIHTSYQLKQKMKYILQEFMNIDAFIMKKAADNNEIMPHDNYNYLAQIICTCLQSFFPPYDIKYSIEYRTDLNREDIRSLLITDMSIALEIILSGLKTAKLKKENNNEA